MRTPLAFCCLTAAVVVAIVAPAALAQNPQKKAPPSIQKIGDNVFLVGVNRVDVSKREVSVEGTLNAVTTLEFVANTYGGLKAYESAVTMNTDAITFNAALLLIGLDPAHAHRTTRHFDPVAPQGDQVEIWIETLGPDARRFRAEELIYDRVAQRTMTPGPWVYTGSWFYQDRYIADSDGVLIGFVHSPSPVIESPKGAGINNYGSVVLNPHLGIPAGTPLRLTVKALP